MITYTLRARLILRPTNITEISVVKDRCIVNSVAYVSAKELVGPVLFLRCGSPMHRKEEIYQGK
jgi:hypothetical protein